MGHAGGRPFRLPVPEYPTVLRFYLPLIEPDGRVSRIRLPDKVSCLRPWEFARSRTEPGKAQILIQVVVREACGSLTLDLVFSA